MRLQFKASALHVRTARLVAVTVARRAGFDEDQVEGVRQAVGEACALTVSRLDPGDDVMLTLDDAPDRSDHPARLVVRVQPVEANGTGDTAGDPADLGLAVLREMTDDVAFEDAGDGPAMRLTWLERTPG